MTSSLSLKEVLSKVPNIHAFNNNGVTILSPKTKGAKNIDKLLEEYSISGNGTREQPFTPRSSMDINPHNVIVALWLHSLKSAQNKSSLVFIQANDWIFQATPEGVISGDAYFTRLLLEV